MIRLLAALLSVVSAVAVPPAAAFEIPRRTGQLIVGIAESWDSSKATLQRYERSGSGWRAVGKPIPARIGRAGLAWGLGIHPVPKGARLKKEGDWRAPAGVFRIGGVWGYEANIRKHPKLYYRQVTPRDLWIEDPKSPSYNRNVVLDHDPATPWEKKQQMRQNDPAHALKLFIAHNAPPHAVPGRGSSIFFHIWRGGGAKPTAGCTAMPEKDLRTLIAWLDPTRQPLYILLPRSEYSRLKKNRGICRDRTGMVGTRKRRCRAGIGRPPRSKDRVRHRTLG